MERLPSFPFVSLSNRVDPPIPLFIPRKNRKKLHRNRNMYIFHPLILFWSSSITDSWRNRPLSRRQGTMSVAMDDCVRMEIIGGGGEKKKRRKRTEVHPATNDFSLELHCGCSSFRRIATVVNSPLERLHRKLDQQATLFPNRIPILR